MFQKKKKRGRPPQESGPPEPPWPPSKPEEFIVSRRFESYPRFNQDQNIPLQQLVEFFNEVQPTLQPDEELIVRLDDCSYDGIIFGGIGYYETIKQRTPYYDRELKKYEREMIRYEKQLEEYEQELKKWNDALENEKQSDLKQRLKEARKLLKEHGEL